MIKICYNFGQIVLKIYISASKFDKLFLILNKFWPNLYQKLLNFWRSGAEIFLSIQKTRPRYSKFDQNLLQFWSNRNENLCFCIKIWQIVVLLYTNLTQIKKIIIQFVYKFYNINSILKTNYSLFYKFDHNLTKIWYYCIILFRMWWDFRYAMKMTVSYRPLLWNVQDFLEKQLLRVIGHGHSNSTWFQMVIWSKFEYFCFYVYKLYQNCN